MILIDARKGLLQQTRRHLLLARLLGIRHVVVVRQQDGPRRLLADVFERVRDEVSAPSPRRSASRRCDVLPGSALRGDMVVDRGDALDWYRGPTLLERLESLDSGAEQRGGRAVPLPGAAACPRPQGDVGARLHAAAIESGTMLAGDEVQIAAFGPAHARARDPARTTGC